MSLLALAAAIVAYGGAAILHLRAQRRRWLLRWARWATFLALALQAALLMVQAHRGMPPDVFDWLQGAVFAFVLAWAVWERTGRAQGTGALVVPLAFAITAATALLHRSGASVELQGTLLLWLHIVLLAAGFACLALAGLAALLRRFAELRLRRGNFTPVAALPQLHDGVRRFLAVGLLLDALGIGLGAIYAHSVWGAYWSWSPKETVTLFVWAIDLAAYVTVRTGRRLALGDWLAAAALVGMLVNVWAVGLLGGPHRFN